MTQLGNRPESGAEDARSVEQILQTVTQDLKSLQQGLIVELSQEVTRLQAEKTRLMVDIEKLQAYQRALQSRQDEMLSQQQVAQQQLWAKQLAQILAKHLQIAMVQRLNQLAAMNHGSVGISSTSSELSSSDSSSGHAYQLLASLDAAFSTAFKTLQQELTSYQNSLSQQLNRMNSLEQQGEAILDALVSRLREQLQIEASRPSSVSSPLIQQNGQVDSPSGHSSSQQTLAQPQGVVQPTSHPIPFAVPGTPRPLPTKPRRELSQFQLGLLLVLLSTVTLSFHNVVVRILGKESVVFGAFKLGGVIHLNLIGNSLMILWLRMLVVLPLMVPVAMVLYPPVWRDMKRFLTARDRRPLFNVIGSGGFLFLSQVLIYIAIGQIGAGPAVTILFMYPLFTVPLAWLLFGDRPTKLRWIVMGTILLGVVLTALPSSAMGGNMAGGGVLVAIASGVAFAFYLIFMQLGFKKLHPVPVSLIQFSTIFLLSSVILILPWNLGVHVDKPTGFIVSGIILGALTLVGYLANNFGVRFMGAARASIVASSGPVMTALLAFLIIQNPLKSVQWLGILLVTLGVAALSFERMKGQTTAAKSAKS
jgi:drug/metabolite transporter (DMT)-like permease